MPPNNHPTNTVILAPTRREFNDAVEAAATIAAPWLTDQLQNIDAVRDALYSDDDPGTNATIWRDDRDDSPYVHVTRDAERALRAAATDQCTYAIVTDRDTLSPSQLAHVASHGTHTHFTAERVTIHSNGDAYDTDALTALTARRDTPTDTTATETTTSDQVTGDELPDGIQWHGGRPPIGCTSRAGQLLPADNYRDVCDALQLVADGAMSPGEAAVKLDCTRKTIENALQRGELYQLDR